MTKKMLPETCVVVGLGYVGLPTSVVLAEAGMNVIGVDISDRIVQMISAGLCPIEEPDLPESLARLVGSGRICARRAPVEADVFILAVPTPFTGGYKPDLTAVEAATRSIAPYLRKGNLVIVESTVPVGATEQVGRWIKEMRPDLKCASRGSDEVPDVMIAHCPERVFPGRMLKEIVENNRVVGGLCRTSTDYTLDFYRGFVTGNCQGTDSRTAELCKLSENAFRDVNIAFANELSDICEDVGINVWDLIKLANQHPRVNILKPGPGVGGHCIAVDPWFIVSALGNKGRLIREARWINSGRPRQVVLKAMELITAGNIKRVGCLGLAYKADIDDLRESPAVEVVHSLSQELLVLGQDIEVLVSEPHISELPPSLASAHRVRLVETDSALAVDLIILLADHTEFSDIPASKLKGKRIIDTRGLWADRIL